MKTPRNERHVSPGVVRLFRLTEGVREYANGECNQNAKTVRTGSKASFCLMLLLVGASICAGAGYSPPSRPFESYSDRLLSDQMEFYRPGGLFNLGLAAGSAAALANTTADESLYRHYQKNWGESQPLTDLSAIVTNLGDGRFVLPGMVVGHMMARAYLDGGRSSWGGRLTERSLRAYLVGAAPLLLAQRVGGSRPTERPGVTSSSPWVLGTDTNAASGHAFIGAVPFLTAAKMTESRQAKLMWYGLSALPAWSRVHDGAHYPSQSILGWSLANLSVDAVHRTESEPRLSVAILPVPRGIFVTLGWRF